jgi:hypothetical protein
VKPGPCWRCGSETIVQEAVGHDSGMFVQVVCTNYSDCGAESKTFRAADSDSKDEQAREAIAWWARRAPWPTLPELPGDGDIPEML